MVSLHSYINSGSGGESGSRVKPNDLNHLYCQWSMKLSPPQHHLEVKGGVDVPAVLSQ